MNIFSITCPITISKRHATKNLQQVYLETIVQTKLFGPPTGGFVDRSHLSSTTGTMAQSKQDFAY